MRLESNKVEMVKQVFFNCKKDVKKTIEKLINIECDTNGLSEEEAKKKVVILLQEAIEELKG